MSDREKLIEIITDYADFLDWERIYGIADTIMSECFVTDINVGDKWIPVSERLPKFGQQVLVSCAGYELNYVTAMNFWSDKRDEWQSVTHWMPLPEPPKECE